MIREALQRHPDVFLELIKDLQNEASDRKANEVVEEVIEEEEVVSVVIYFLLIIL